VNSASSADGVRSLVASNAVITSAPKRSISRTVTPIATAVSPYTASWSASVRNTAGNGIPLLANAYMNATARGSVRSICRLRAVAQWAIDSQRSR
jgi:hypothetical protein